MLQPSRAQWVSRRRTLVHRACGDAVGNVETTGDVFTWMVDLTPPTVAPRLSPPTGQSAIKNNDTLTISGLAPDVALVASARVLPLDASGTAVGSLDLVVERDIQLNSGSYAGSVVLGTLPATATAVRLDVTVHDAAGNAATLSSAIIEVDNVAPAAPALVYDRERYPLQQLGHDTDRQLGAHHGRERLRDLDRHYFGRF